MNIITTIGTALLNFLFPPRCPLCGEFVAASDAWCPSCIASALSVRRLNLTGLSGVFVLGKYSGGLRKIIHRLKYERQTSARRQVHFFLQAADSHLTALRRQLPADIIAVPVPLHELRERKRGFNQAEVIFSDCLNKVGITTARLLSRPKATKPQFNLNPAQRRQNLIGAFALPEGATVRGKNILLLDDILTTGATLTACAKILHQSGAAAVFALVLSSDHVP